MLVVAKTKITSGKASFLDDLTLFTHRSVIGNFASAISVKMNPRFSERMNPTKSVKMNRHL